MEVSETKPVVTAKFLLERETKGALRYQEVDDKDQPLETVWAKIGTLYIRKTAFERGAEPDRRWTCPTSMGHFSRNSSTKRYYPSVRPTAVNYFTHQMTKTVRLDHRFR
jgi:hypothetical protein